MIHLAALGVSSRRGQQNRRWVSGGLRHGASEQGLGAKVPATCVPVGKELQARTCPERLRDGSKAVWLEQSQEKAGRCRDGMASWGQFQDRFGIYFWKRSYGKVRGTRRT